MGKNRIPRTDLQVRILVVDDEEGVRLLLADYLEEAVPSAKVQVSGCTEEALSILSQGPVDLLISDLGLPDGDGREFLPRILKEHSETTVIVVSGTEDIQDAVRLFRSGVYDFLVKPPDFGRLGMAVSRVLDRLRLSRENLDLRRRIAGSSDLDPEASQEPGESAAGAEPLFEESGPLLTLDAASQEFERRYLLRVLEDCEWHVTLAAEQAGISRGHLHRLLRRHNLKRPDAE